MPSSASSEATSAATLSKTSPECSPPSQHVEVLSSTAPESLPAQWLSSMQEALQRYMQERFRILEQQLAVEQQRQRDRVEEDLHHVAQQLVAAGREQQQQQQTLATACREIVEQMRREFSAALQHLSEDVTHALRQTEEQTRRGLENLRTEVLQMLREHDQDAVKRQLPGEYLSTVVRALHSSDGNHRP